MKQKCKNRLCIIGFNDLWLRLIGIPLIGLILPFVFSDFCSIGDTDVYIFLAFMSMAHTFIYWHIDRGIIILFRKTFPNHKDYKKRLFYQSVTTLIAIFILSFIIEMIIPHTDKYHSFTDEKDHYLYKVMVSLVITLIIVSIYEARYAFDLFKNSIIQNEALKKENAEAQLQTLKEQINPHFLFNSLNTLTSVIPENQELAVLFVENLSKVYRYILEIKDKDLVSLEEELVCIEAYKSLLQIRFGNNIKFIPPKLECSKKVFLVPLSIQMLIENAIKHNIVSKSQQLQIEITILDDKLSVKNNLQLKSSVQNSTNTGLLNIQKRFEILTKKSIVINQTENYFEVVLPLIEIGKVK